MTNRGRARGAPRILVALVVAGIVIVGIRFLLPRVTSEVSRTRAISKRSGGGSSSTTEQGEFEKLIGRWRRPDGGYIMDVRAVDAAGKLRVDYYNPKPINVSKSNVTREKEWLKVFVELTDVGYPGATYDLTYDPHHDIMRGTYFQPTLGQSFEVEFVRVP